MSLKSYSPGANLLIVFFIGLSLTRNTQAETVTSGQAFIELLAGGDSVGERVDAAFLFANAAKNLIADNLLNEAQVTEINHISEETERLLVSINTQYDPDPLLNLRVDIFNPTDTPMSFNVQLLLPTEVTAGPTFNNTFANIDLIDSNNDDFAYVLDMSTFFSVIDDPGGDLINGFANLGESFFFGSFDEGKQNLFDNIGSGPNSNDFEGDGFNYLRFVTNGTLSPGDQLSITGMGCYSTDENYCPDRYEILASAVPVPAALWLFGSGLLGLVGVARRKKV